MKKKFGVSLEELKDVDIPETLREKLSGYFSLMVESYVAIITPAQAAEYVKGNNARKPTPGQVQKYAKMMIDGKWTVSQAIYFDKNGKLYDGQHRLLAVIQSQIPQPFLIVHGLPPEASDCTDDGRPRKSGDIYKNKLSLDAGGWIETLVRRILLAFSAGSQKEGLAYAIENYNKHKDAIDRTLEVWPKPSKEIKAPVIGAFTRAFVYYKSKPGMLKKLKHIAQRFDSKNWNMLTDKPLVELRSWSDQQRGKAGCTGGGWSRDAYGMAADAIKAVLENKTWTKLVVPEADPFGTVADARAPLFLIDAM